MASLKGKKISALAELTNPSDTTLIPVVDVSSSTPITKYSKLSSVKSAIIQTTEILDTDQKLNSFIDDSKFAIVDSSALSPEYQTIFGLSNRVEIHCYSTGDVSPTGKKYVQEFSNSSGDKYSRTMSWYPASGGPTPSPAGIYPDGPFVKQVQQSAFLSEDKGSIHISELDSIETPGSYSIYLLSGDINGYTSFNLCVESLSSSEFPGNVGQKTKQTVKTYDGNQFYRVLSFTPVNETWSAWTSPVIRVTTVNQSQYRNHEINSNENFFSVESRSSNGNGNDNVNFILPYANSCPGRIIMFYYAIAGSLSIITDDLISTRSDDYIMLKNSVYGEFSAVTTIVMNESPGPGIIRRSFISLISDGSQWLEM